MAKRNDWDKQHTRNISRYVQQVNTLYQSLTQEAATIGTSISHFNPNRPFSFSDYPQTKKHLDSLIIKLKEKTQTIIINGVESEWTLSNNKNNELSRRVFGSHIGKLSQAQYRKYFTSNDMARKAFLARKIVGLNLSDRVWKYTNQFKKEIEIALDIGIRDGLPANELARDLRQYLQYPDKLFRRVHDEHGQLQLSKNAKTFNPGMGIYRSSQKNAERLTRTETNIAYRQADYERWQQFDFVIGIEIRRSNNPYPCPLCDQLLSVIYHPFYKCV